MRDPEIPSLSLLNESRRVDNLNSAKNFERFVGKHQGGMYRLLKREDARFNHLAK